MSDTMEHEKMRFDTMTFDQLRTRVGKITKNVKLDNFIYVCNEKIIENSNPRDRGKKLQYETLRTLAIQRRNELFGNRTSHPTFDSRTGIPMVTPQERSNALDIHYQADGRRNYNGRVYPVGRNTASGSTTGIATRRRERPTCFGIEYNSQKRCMSCAFEELCERSFLEHAENREKIRAKVKESKVKVPKTVMDSLPIRRIKLD